MKKSKFISLALCGIMLSSCGNSGENTAEESGYSETSRTSESVSETTVSETETEILDTSETTVQEETESAENFDKVKDRIIYDDGENSLTAGQYIDALLECEDIYKTLHALHGIQFADFDSDGIPELLLYDDLMTKSEYYAVSADGKARYIHNKSLHDNWAWEFPYGHAEPYELNGEIVWITECHSSGSGAGGDGIYFVRYDGNEIEVETIRESRYTNTDSNIAVWGEKMVWQFFWQGEEVSEEEYNSRYEKFLGDMTSLDAPELRSTIIHGAGYEFKEALSLVLKEYLEAADTVIYSDGESSLTAEQYVDILGNCEEFTGLSHLYGIQLADLNGNGIPEVLARVGDYYHNNLEIFSVSESGGVEKISAPTERAFKSVTPYEKDGKTVWIADTADMETDGEEILRLLGNSAEFEEICAKNHLKNEYFWRGEQVSYDEYKKLREDFYGEMGHSAEIHPVDYGDKTNLQMLSDVMEEYVRSLPYTYNEIKDTVIYSGGGNVLTAGQYIDALLQCRDFTELYKNGIQLADLNGDGIPEASARIAVFPITEYFSVSAEGKAAMLYDENGENEIYAELPESYESEGKTVWLADFYSGGSAGGGGGDCVLTYEDGKIKKEIIRCYNYSKDYNTFEYYYTYYWGSDGYWDDTKGEEVSEEEYESRYEAFLAEMQPSEAGCPVNRVYGGATYDYCELTELLAGMMKEYLGV